MTKKQYFRLSMVLFIPLLILGWWLSEKEFMISHHHLINCEEFESHISCVTVDGTKEEKTSWMFGNGSVTLLRSARLTFGLHHPVITVNVPEPRFVDYYVLSPAGGGVQKTLSLPPRIDLNYAEWAFMSCNIEPMPNSATDWVYRCFKGEPEAFRFADESTNQKYRQAVSAIKDQMQRNDSMAFRAQLASVLAPLFFYGLLSLSFLVLAKLSRFIINGRWSNA